jgi:hypothetical protein
MADPLGSGEDCQAAVLDDGQAPGHASLTGLSQSFSAPDL